jgi:hypothetical protein
VEEVPTGQAHQLLQLLKLTQAHCAGVLREAVLQGRRRQRQRQRLRQRRRRRRRGWGRGGSL